MSPEPKLLNQGELAALSGAELLAMMKRLAAAERTLSVYALAQLGEIARRKLYKPAGYNTMFAYCVGELGYSEPMASRRLQAADAARGFPEVLSLIKDGRITICALTRVSKYLTGRNSADILKKIEGKSVRAVERIVAELAPLPDTRDLIRSMPGAVVSAWAPLQAAVKPPSVEPPSVEPPSVEPPSVEPPSVEPPSVEPPSVEPPSVEPPSVVPTSTEPPVMEPTALRSPRPMQKIMPRSPDRVFFSFTGSEELRRVIDRCTELLWHKFPSGRLEDVLLEVGKYYLKVKDPELLPISPPKAPRRVETRFIPRWVKSVVYRRDGGRCMFTSGDGRRCEARHGLEYDHILPWAKGGRSDDPKNIRLLCRAHNQWAASEAGLS